MRCIQNYNFGGKRALIRVDFNVPLDDSFNIVDDARMRGVIPTVLQVTNGGGAAVLLSHLGRPQKGYEKRFSLRHLVARLSEMLGTQVVFASSCVGEETHTQVQRLGPGEVLLLENVRFQAGETRDDPGLAQALAAWGDVYVNDAFGTTHRRHVSTTRVAHHFDDKLAGYLLQKELASANKILQAVRKPFVAIIGGSKVVDKIKPLNHLMHALDYLLLGGGIANTFHSALGGDLGASLLETDQLELAFRLTQQAQQRNVSIVLPKDVVAAQPSHKEVTVPHIVPGSSVPAGYMALDIGPVAQREFATIIRHARTILWCGPIGVFEMKNFRHGTRAVAAAVAQATGQGAFSLIGGGDSSASIRKLGYANQVSHLSTGGGALLTYLGGMPLPGVEVLN